MSERWRVTWDYFAKTSTGQTRRRPSPPLVKTFDTEAEARAHANHVRVTAAAAGGVVVAVVRKETAAHEHAAS